MPIRSAIRVAAGCMALMCAMLVQVRADTITVTNINDSGPGSLRQALADANEGDTITFAVTGTIGLTSGELLVDKNLAINGPGVDQLAVNGNAASRIFHVQSGNTVMISDLTITNGRASFPDNGGGIFTELATLTVANCTISDNSADVAGGIYNLGSFGKANLVIVNSTLSGNSSGLGGAIVNDGDSGDARLQVVNSTFSDNGDPDTFSGGGIFNGGSSGNASLEVVNSTLSDNLAENGGGIFNAGASGSARLQVVNSTLSGNHNGDPTVVGVGGGIYNDGTFGSANLQVVNSTFSGNLADEGGGIFNAGDSGQAVVEIGNTLLNAGASGENIVNQKDDGATVTSLGYNLSSDDGGGFLTGPGDQINTDPLLGPLEDNGGPTLTHTLLPGSPAIDAGDPGFTPPPFFDQRGPGFDRVVNGRLDIGSFEAQGPTPPPTPTPTATPRVTPRPRPTPHPRPTPP